MAAPAGLAWLIEHFGLRVPAPAVRSETIAGARRTVVGNGQVLEQYPAAAGYAPKELFGHLRFALRYEPLDAGAWNAVVHALEPNEMERWLREDPTGRFTRRAWYLYEALTGRTLDIADVPPTGYVDLAQESLQLTGPVVRARRQRVNVNWIGDGTYNVLIRRTPRLREAMAGNLQERASQIVRGCEPSVLARAIYDLFTKEAKSSFAIEGEAPSSSRAERFVTALAGAAEFDAADAAAFVDLQNTIVDRRYAASVDWRNAKHPWRTEQNYVGHTRSDYTEGVDFVCPKPQDVPELMDGWMRMTSQLQLGASGVDAVCAAAAVAFGFVLIHPFEDGNGRIHRFLIHHVLARRGFTPQGLLFPVSAVMLRDRRAYDAVLERFSASVMPFVDWTLDGNARMEVGNPTKDLYRFWDATPFAEYLYGVVEETIGKDLAEEIRFLSTFDRAVRRTMEIVDMPDRRASLLVRLILQNRGTLSETKRKDFSELSDGEVSSIEAAVREISG
jgi:hypothetical protein